MQEDVYQAFNVRVAKASDSAKLVQIIRNVFEEYGWVFNPEDEIPDILHFSPDYEIGKKRLVVAEIEGEVGACAGLKPDDRGGAFTRVYVAKEFRRKGIARAMMQDLLANAEERGMSYVHLWTDTQFEDAHRFYESLGFKYTGHVRPLNDVNGCYEYHYELYI